MFKSNTKSKQVICFVIALSLMLSNAYTTANADKTAGYVLTGSSEATISEHTAEADSTTEADTAKEPDRKVKPFSKKVKKIKVSNKEVNSFFSKSVFTGSSLVVGQANYVRSKGKSYLGGPLVLGTGSYSFANENRHNIKYMLKYKGRAIRARDVLKATKRKYMFVHMGINDFLCSGAHTYSEYEKYLNGIRKSNPGALIFVEATNPIRREKAILNNKNIRKLHKRLKKYCKKHKNTYFIDIHKSLKGSDGKLKRAYCSDGYVHMTYKGYAVWMNKVKKDVKKLLLKEKIARKAVEYTYETKDKGVYNEAVKYVNKLSSGTCKSKLKKKLKNIKNSCT